MFREERIRDGSQQAKACPRFQLIIRKGKTRNKRLQVSCSESIFPDGPQLHTSPQHDRTETSKTGAILYVPLPPSFWGVSTTPPLGHGHPRGSGCSRGSAAPTNCSTTLPAKPLGNRRLGQTTTTSEAPQQNALVLHWVQPGDEHPSAGRKPGSSPSEVPPAMGTHLPLRSTHPGAGHPCPCRAPTRGLGTHIPCRAPTSPAEHPPGGWAPASLPAVETRGVLCRHQTPPTLSPSTPSAVLASAV